MEISDQPRTNISNSESSDRPRPRAERSRADNDGDWRRGNADEQHVVTTQSWRESDQNRESWNWDDRSDWKDRNGWRDTGWQERAQYDTNSTVGKTRGKGRGVGGRGRNKWSPGDGRLEDESVAASLDNDWSDGRHISGNSQPNQHRDPDDRRDGKGRGGERRRINPQSASRKKGADEHVDNDALVQEEVGHSKGSGDRRDCKGKAGGRRLIGPNVGFARDTADRHESDDIPDQEISIARTTGEEEMTVKSKTKDVQRKGSKGRGKDRQHRERYGSKDRGGDEADMTQSETLHEELGRGSYECMICINKVRRHDSIWSCSNCFASLHLKCIHQWIRKSCGDSKGPEYDWSCPGCRYHFVDTLPKYSCFCGKMLEPQANPHILAHSCGEVCERSRNCSHPCNQLCHAGPCPPCTAIGPPGECHCGKEAKAVTRCGDPSRWSCGSICGATLACGKHTCPLKCHAGPCPPCKTTSKEKCFCGAEETDRLCTQEAWACGGICGKLLDCGEHYCEQSCHLGDCEPCQRKPEIWGDRCACGRTRNCKGEAAASLLVKWVGARKFCTDALPLCGSRCDRPFAGCDHRCPRTCHEGSCGKCDKIVLRDCRCRRSKIEVSCVDSTPALCTQVCRTKKHCGIHKCDVICCPGHNDRNHENHFCLQVCGKPLACGVHVCEEFCHLGKCPPCRIIQHEPLCCACGMESIQPPVRCGTAPPRCMEICGGVLDCGHICTSTCHFGEHPLCCELVDRQCLGGHRIMKFQPCHVGPMSCGEKCGKHLECGHRCAATCHSGNCPLCTLPCGKTRLHCDHRCDAPCHPGEECADDPCRHKIKSSCPCGLRVEVQVCGAFSGRKSDATVLKCGNSCGERSRIPCIDGIRLSPQEERYAADVHSLATKNSKYIAMLEHMFITALSSNSRVALPACDTNRRVLAVEYARLHWRLRTITKRDSVEGWYVVTVEATKDGRVPRPRLSEMITEKNSKNLSAQLGSQPCLRFQGCKGEGDEIYDLVGLEDLLGVRPGQNQGEILAFVGRGSTATASFKKLTSQEPVLGHATPVASRSDPHRSAGTGLQVSLENVLRLGGSGPQLAANSSSSTRVSAWGKAAAPKAEPHEVSSKPTAKATAPAKPEPIADSWEDDT